MAKDEEIQELGAGLLVRHSQDAMSFVHKCAADGSSELSLHDVPTDRACYLTSYTQEWFACKRACGGGSGEDDDVCRAALSTLRGGGVGIPSESAAAG